MYGVSAGAAGGWPFQSGCRLRRPASSARDGRPPGAAGTAATADTEPSIGAARGEVAAGGQVHRARDLAFEHVAGAPHARMTGSEEQTQRRGRYGRRRPEYLRHCANLMTSSATLTPSRVESQRTNSGHAFARPFPRPEVPNAASIFGRSMPSGLCSTLQPWRRPTWHRGTARRLD